jgi:hypothetical protein
MRVNLCIENTKVHLKMSIQLSQRILMRLIFELNINQNLSETKPLEDVGLFRFENVFCVLLNLNLNLEESVVVLAV